MGLVKPPHRIVVRMLPSGQPQVWYLISAGRFQLTGGSHPSHEPIEPYAQQRTGMISRGTKRVTIDVDLHSRPANAVQSIHKGSNEARRVILGKEIIKGRGKQPGLFSMDWS